MYRGGAQHSGTISETSVGPRGVGALSIPVAFGVAALGTLFVVVPLVQASTILGMQTTSPIGGLAIVAAALVFFIGRRYKAEPITDWAAGLIVLAAWYPAAALGLLAFFGGKRLGLGPIRGLIAWSAGIAVGAWLSTVLGFQGPPTLTIALPAFAAASAVALWYILDGFEPLNRMPWVRWVGAATALVLLVFISGFAENAVTTPAEQAVVRVLNLGPGTAYVSAYPHELVGGPPAGTGTPLPCGRTMLVAAPRGSHGPWRLYAEPSAESQINGANNEPFLLYGGVPGRPERILLAPVERSWFERWLPAPHC